MIPLFTSYAPLSKNLTDEQLAFTNETEKILNKKCLNFR